MCVNSFRNVFKFYMDHNQFFQKPLFFFLIFESFYLRYFNVFSKKSWWILRPPGRINDVFQTIVKSIIWNLLDVLTFVWKASFASRALLYLSAAIGIRRSAVLRLRSANFCDKFGCDFSSRLSLPTGLLVLGVTKYVSSVFFCIFANFFSRQFCIDGFAFGLNRL